MPTEMSRSTTITKLRDVMARSNPTIWILRRCSGRQDSTRRNGMNQGRDFGRRKAGSNLAHCHRVDSGPCIGLRVARCFQPGLAAVARIRMVDQRQSVRDALTRRFATSGRYPMRWNLSYRWPVTNVASVRRMLYRRRSQDQSQDALVLRDQPFCRVSSVVFAPLSIELSASTATLCAEFYALFRAPIRFGAEWDAMVFRRDDVERPLPTGQPCAGPSQ